MKLIFDDFPADLFNLIMHGEFYRATEKDYTRLMRIFNSCVIVKQEPKPEATPYEPKGDLISREALIREIGRTDEWYKGRSICNIIDNAQAVERPQGKWKTNEGYDGDEYYECSNCGEPWFFSAGTPKDNNMNFCPNCGADMRGGAE